MTVYTSIDQLIGNTPLLELKGIEAKEGLKARVLGKLEYFNPAGSVKDRIAYLRSHVKARGEAVDVGFDLIAYTWWGPIDLVSAGTGEMRKRYGFVYVDKHDDGTGDLHRSRKDSFFYYKRLIASNGTELD